MSRHVDRVRWPAFGSLAAVVFVADQVTKAVLTGALGPGESVAVVGDLLRLVHGQNTGALFGLFRENAALFAAVSVAVVGLIVWYEAQAGRSLLISVALGLLLGGALGNFLDRVRIGYVVDFVDAGVGTLRWYTFNVADASISFAILILLLVAIRPGLTGSAGGPEADG